MYRGLMYKMIGSLDMLHCESLTVLVELNGTDHIADESTLRRLRT